MSVVSGIFFRVCKFREIVVSFYVILVKKRVMA